MKGVITEREAEDFLENKGFQVVPRAFAKDKYDIKKISKTINFPWAMKASSKKLVHKSRMGGVILNIQNREDAEKAFEKLSQVETFEEAIIQEMISGSELIIGIKKTPEFSHVIMFGKGGTNVEQEKDVSFRVIPITQKDAQEMIQEIKFYTTLKENKANLKLMKDNLMKVSNLVQKYPKISELDINPLIVSKESAKVIDARIVFEE